MWLKIHHRVVFGLKSINLVVLKMKTQLMVRIGVNMTSDTEEIKSTLVSRNITVLGKRTSVRLEPEMWRELKGISIRESCTIHDLCTLISLRKSPQTSLTAAIRVFLMLYFRAATTEDGHKKAGHGNFAMMKERAGVESDWSALKLKRSLEQDDWSKSAKMPEVSQSKSIKVYDVFDAKLNNRARCSRSCNELA